MKWWSRLLLIPCFLMAISVLPFVQLLRGEYIYDDILFIEQNQDIYKIKSFRDCLSFQMEPTRPVTNFLTAVTFWLGGGRVFVERVFSIFLHFGVVVLLFLNLNLLVVRLNLARGFPFWICLLFAVHPLHGETIAVAKFRGEILASLFALAAGLVTQVLAMGPPAFSLGSRTQGEVYSKKKFSLAFRIGLYLSLFLFMGASILSKEVFGVIVPTVVLAFFSLASLERVRERGVGFSIFVIVVTIVWGIVLAFRLRSDLPFLYSYESHVGPGVLSFNRHIWLAARTLLEGFVKLVTAYGITTARLSERAGLGSALGLAGSCAVVIFASIACSWLLRFPGWLRIFASIFGVSAGIYLIIPNINIGSDHYWYFPSLAAMSLGVFVFWNLLVCLINRPQRMMGLVAVLYGGYFCFTLQGRVWELRSVVRWYLAELEANPESLPRWIYFIDQVGNRSRTLDFVQPFVIQARKLFPHVPYFLVAEFAYHKEKKNLLAAERILRALEKLSIPREQLGQIHADLGLMNVAAGECEKASKEFEWAALSASRQISSRENLAKYRQWVAKQLKDCKDG